MDLTPINYEHLAIQKILHHFDLLRLKQEHPEFEKDIVLQLQGFSKDSVSIRSYEKIDTVKNIRQSGRLMKKSDSIQKMTLYFDVVTKDSVKTDSILAVISTKFVLIDDVMVPTTKVSFRKIK